MAKSWHVVSIIALTGNIFLYHVPEFKRLKTMATSNKDQERLRRASDSEQNAQIDNLTMFNLEYYKSEGRAAIDRRIAELDREWDLERTLEMNAAAFAFTGSLLAAVVHRRWAILPLVVGAFLGQHALQGWCPPVEVFRRMGVRTRQEIDREKYALKALRGDFAGVSDSTEAWAAVNF